MKKRVVLGLSGGVDSAVAAYLLKQQGYEVIGVFMRNWDSQLNNDILGNPTNDNDICPQEQDYNDAKAVAKHLGIEIRRVDFIKEYWDKVFTYFIDEYAKGRTPNPDILCNKHIKFKAFLEYAEELNADFIATGHYARVEYDDATGRYLLKKGLDANKDQSYVLYSLTQEQLMHTQFPLGELPKPKVREIAEEQGLINAHKHDSQDICFVTSGSNTEFIRKYTGKEYPEGDFVDLKGNVLGRHKGIIHYTVGQRKGLGLALAKPMYVYGIDKEKNQVILSDEADLFSSELIANDLNLISVPKIEGKMRVKAKVRYRHAEQPATVEQIDEDHIRVVFDEPQRAITKGQAVVLYDGDVVVGGGTIL